MIPTLTPDQARALRLRAGRLAALPPDDRAGVDEVTRALVGIQAQDLAAAGLAVRARSVGLTAADVTRARTDERSVVRTWALRGTLHLLAAEDVGWLTALLGPGCVAGDRRRRLALGLDDATCARATRLLRDTLAARGPLTRAEIVAALAAHGVALEGQAAPHLLYYAAFTGGICGGPDRGAQPTYALTADWARPGPALPEEAAAAELARRYLAAYGPATPADLAAWSGLPLGTARAAWARIAGELLEVDLAGAPAWLPAGRRDWLADPPAPPPRLLGAFDTYLLGYRGRDLTVDAAHAARINAGGGMIRPALLLAGRAAGTWLLRRGPAGARVEVAPFAALPPGAVAGLEAEAADVGRFLGESAALRLLPPA
jgi:hypothetical protein